ncbi:MAG: TonB-dependent receptor plug domain-containing protein, partial [Bacteroidaceae bacterium]|nr:TonB-dependent receptor plug domain-containing protein [Bacteroidaceae bacterium]
MKRVLLCTLLAFGAQMAVAQQPDTLRQVTVAGQRRQVVYRMDRKKIDAQQILSASGGTAADVLATMPSVQVEADGEIAFRGSKEFLVYIDGKPSPLTGTAALRQIPAAVIQHIELLTTPGARYRAEGDVG